MAASAILMSLPFLNHETMLLLTFILVTPMTAAMKKTRPTATVAFGLFAPMLPRARIRREDPFTSESFPGEARLIFSTLIKVKKAGIRVKLESRSIAVPKATPKPKTLTGIMLANRSEANPTAVVMSEYIKGTPTDSIVAIMAAFLSFFSLYLKENSLKMCMLSVAMAMRNTGALELIM